MRIKDCKSNKENKINIDLLVDNLINKKTKNNQFFSLKKSNYIKIIKDFFKKKTTKRIISGFILILVLFALWASSINSLYGDVGSDIIVSLEPRAVYNGELIQINVSIPSYYHISSLTADMGGQETVELILLDNSSDYYFWTGNWIVQNISPGYHIARIFGEDIENISYSLSVEWKVLDLVDNSNQTDFIEPGGNDSIQPSIEPDMNDTFNETEILPDLNDTFINISELIEKSEFGIAEKPINDKFEPSKEIIEERTIYSKTFREDFSINKKVISIGPIHYLDDKGNLKDIDTNFIISNYLNYDYEVTKGFYKIKLKKDVSSKDLLEYCFGDSYIKIEILDLDWINNNGEKILISMPNHVGGIVYGNKVIYSNAFGDGIDVEFLYHPQYFGKHLIINSLDNLPQVNNNMNSYLEFNFKMSISDNLDVFIDSQRIDNSEISTSKIVEFRDKNTGKTKFFFNEPYCIDSQGNTNPVILLLRKNGSEIIISKHIDKTWLEAAVYPVIIDPVSTIYLEGDIYDMYDQDGTNVDNDVDVQIGRSGASHWDGYWAFPISSDIITGTINSVTFTGYVSSNDIDKNPNLYGLQQEDCPALEGAAAPNTWTRTTASYAWALMGAGTGSKKTGDIKTVFNEWISDYTHSSAPDRFGIVIDDTVAGNNREVFFYDYSHASYNSHTYLTINYIDRDWDPPVPDPLTWVTEPYNASSSSITMIATTPTDNTTPIAYYFNETTGASGGTDSGWQASATYTDIGLSENTQYGYEVKARDSNSTPNEGNYSTPVSYEYTSVDPPTDNELTFLIGTTWINASVAQPPNPTSSSTGSYFNWVTGGANNSGWQTGIYYHNRTGLTENTQYGVQVRYRNGDADASFYNPTEKTNYTYCEPPTDGEFTIDGYHNSWINMSVAQPNNPTTGITAAYFECVTGGASSSGWLTNSVSGRYYYNATGLSSSTTYGFRVKYRNADGVETTYTSEKQQLTNPPDPPIVTTNESTGVEETNATLWGYLNDDGNGITYCGFYIDTISGGTSTNNSVGIITKGSIFSNNSIGLTQGQLYYFRAWANNSAGFSDGSELTFLTKPDPPNSFIAQVNNSNLIYLEWQKVNGANKTYIERNTTSSWALGQGTTIYNNSGINYEDNGLTPGTTYYYQAWSYTNWTYDSTTLYKWSDNNASAYNHTNAPPTITTEVPINESTDINLIPETRITINDIEGSPMMITWYSNSSGTWQIFGINNSVGNGTYYQTNSNFSSSGTTYWWNVSVYDEVDINNSGIFHFTTSYQPSLSNPGPSNNSITQYTTPICNVTVSDADGGTVTIRFYENTTGSWVLQQTNSSVDVTNPANVVWNNYSNAIQDYTTYWWMVNVSDGKGCYAEEIYHFTTANTSIEVIPSAWDQGVLLVGSSNETTGFYFNLTNNGDVPLYIQIKASNATNATTGGKWILNATSGYDNFTLQYNKSGVGIWTTINLTYDLFSSYLDIGSWQTFDLKLIMATLSSNDDSLSMDLTFRSIKA
jgi:hypothetical protein